jgi:hypothetical protein
VPTRIFRNTGLRRRDVATGFLIPVYREYRAGLCEQLSGIVEATQPHDAVGALYLVRAADDRVFAFDGSHCLRNGTCPNIGDRVYFGAAANGRAGWVSAHRVSDDDAQLLNATRRARPRRRAAGHGAARLMDLFCVKCRRPADFHDDDREIVVCPPPCGSGPVHESAAARTATRAPEQGTPIHVVPPKRYQHAPAADGRPVASTRAPGRGLAVPADPRRRRVHPRDRARRGIAE